MNIKRSVRLTRRSYRRKLIMFGVSIFMSLALVATGFAAWVLSKDAQKTESGAVEIGAVTEASVEISEITFIKDNEAQVNPDKFIFEPLESDTTGRVRYDGESAPENLDVKFTWTISNYQIVGDLFIDFKVPATVYTAVTEGWLSLPAGFVLQDATEEIPADQNGTDAAATYKVLRYTIQNQAGALRESGSTDDGVLSYTVTKDADIVTAVTFTMNIPFSWGADFEGLNPGIYYDTDFPEAPSKGTGVDFDEVKSTLNKFKATLHGIEYNETFEDLSEDDKKTLYDESPVAKYFIVINANVA